MGRTREAVELEQAYAQNCLRMRRFSRRTFDMQFLTGTCIGGALFRSRCV
jgi:hypothetical protein